MACTECNELKRHYISVSSEVRSLTERTRSRHPSPPERRRLHRLRTDAYIAKELMENHLAGCEGAKAR